MKLIVLVLMLIIGGVGCMGPTEKPEETLSDKQIVEAIHIEIYGYSEDDGVDYADDAMEVVDELSGKLFGSIVSEEDAKKKAEAAWSEIRGFEDAKNEKPYIAKFYEEYDVWLVQGNPPPWGIDSNGREYATPGGVSYIIMRNSDGRVLAAWGDC